MGSNRDASSYTLCEYHRFSSVDSAHSRGPCTWLALHDAALTPKRCNAFHCRTLTLQTARYRRGSARGWVHWPTRFDECGECLFIGVDYFYLRAGSLERFHGKFERYQAHCFRRRAKREDQHAFIADSQVRVVTGVVSTIDVMLTHKKHQG